MMFDVSQVIAIAVAAFSAALTLVLGLGSIGVAWGIYRDKKGRERGGRKAECVFRAIIVQNLQRESNACDKFQELAKKHLEWHYDKVGNALVELDAPPYNTDPKVLKVVEAYRLVSDGLLQLKEGGREARRDVLARLHKAEDELRDAQVKRDVGA